MNKKYDHKKKIVRNNEQKPSSKVSVIKSNKDSEDKITSSATLQEKRTVSKLSGLSTIDSVRFQTPELNSALRIARKIETIENIKPRKTKSVSSVPDTKKLSVDEKMTRVINVPYEKHIFKDLVPLTVPKDPMPVLCSRPPLPNKDIEPILSDFCNIKKMPEYSYQPRFKHYEKEEMWNLKKHDNLKLYKLLQM